MKLGTKSVLFGAHTFWLHPWFVALAWWKLYGFPWDPRLWVAFFVHDLGYWGKPNMDGPEGEMHPRWGARLMTRLFDGKPSYDRQRVGGEWFDGWICAYDPATEEDWLLGPWGRFTFYHSRYLAKANRTRFSRLCVADKLAIALTPAWLYLPLVHLTGEVREYMGKARERHSDMSIDLRSARTWYAGVQDYCRRWAHEHRDGRVDTWTRSRAQ